MISNGNSKHGNQNSTLKKKLQIGGQVKSQANIKKYFESKEKDGDTARDSEKKRISINSGMAITTTSTK